ncbi:MAG: FAD:protein FMN transferase [Planctomycetia bacterium]|nr:FAD:protein FMN transferase [Planctomycetia bacterium]
MRAAAAACAWLGFAVVCAASDGDGLPTCVGPAMGTTYRVMLAAPIAGMTLGEVHREVDRLLATIDRAASTWQDDSDASRFNQGAVGEWIEVGPDMVALLEVAARVHEDSNGGFDVTAGPLVELWKNQTPPTAAAIAAVRGRVGMDLVEVRPAEGGRPAALRKMAAGVTLDLAGIGPGYAVDRIGARLVELGSEAHLVELGGEVRAWGSRADGTPWRVRLRSGADADGRATAGRTIELAAGAVLATASSGAGRAIVDPRTGRGIVGRARSVTVIADTEGDADACAAADAWAVAALVLGLRPDSQGLVTLLAAQRVTGRTRLAPSMPAVPPAARPRAP